MKYELVNDKIIVYDKTNFCAKHILECGQIFRYKKLSESEYVVYSQDKTARVLELENCYHIITKDVLYFENFFDLKRDYANIKTRLAMQSETMKLATQFGSGIRILNQDVIETIFGFIISANNNIKRIQGLMEKLSAKCGKNMGDFFAFPTLEQISTLTEQDLKQMGMGFRAKYIFETAKKLLQVDCKTWQNFDTDKLLQNLQNLSGIGPKVADCVALFAFHKTDSFPVDTWVEKIYNTYFSAIPEKNRSKIRQNLLKIFGQDSGYAQQYLFYYKRELDRNN